MVTVYSTPTCYQCKVTKRQLRKRGVEFQEGNLTKKLAEQYNITAAPLVTENINGEEHMLWAGAINPDGIRELASRVAV